MKVNTRALLEKCIEDGLRDGWRRAHKHVENPHETTIKTDIEDAIWLYLDTYFKFEEETCSEV